MMNEEREGRIPGQENELLLSALREGRELEKWQRCFCRLVNVFVCCMDAQGTLLTELEGQEQEVYRIRELIDGEQFENMRLRVAEDALEDQAVETTAYPNLRLAVVLSKINGKPVLNWLICGVLSDSAEEEEYENPPLQGFSSLISEREFLQAVDTLRDMTDTLLEYQWMLLRQQSRYERICSAERQREEKLERMEMLLEITKLLGREEAAESSIRSLLKKTGEFLKLSVAVLYRYPERTVSRAKASSPQSTPEVIAGWYGKDTVWEMQTAAKEGENSLLQPEKTLILSASSSVRVSEREEMKALGLQAVMVIPAQVPGMEKVYVCFGQRERARTWELEEIRFLGEAVKVLQSLLSRYARESRSMSKRKSNTGRTKK